MRLKNCNSYEYLQDNSVSYFEKMRHVADICLELP